MPATRALVFAYACDPDRGSEPGAGALLTSLIATLCDDVVVITRYGLDPVELQAGLGAGVRVVQVGPRSERLPVYGRYLLWICAAAMSAGRLRRARRFDVLHHLTYGSDWFVNPLCFLRKRDGERWVWGPSGGSSYARYSVTRYVTRSLAPDELLRSGLTRFIRKCVHRRLRRDVDVALALNSDSLDAFRRAGFRKSVLQTNALIDYPHLPSRSVPDIPLLVYAGRGVPWKGLSLVIEAMHHLPDAWHLSVAGDDTDTPENRRAADGLDGRVRFLGPLTRADTLDLLSRATAFALPSLHDSAPWAAAEAAGIGVPVVCLGVGGVASMAGPLAIAVSPTPTASLAARIADAVDSSRGRLEAAPYRGHTSERLVATLTEAYFESEQS